MLIRLSRVVSSLVVVAAQGVTAVGNDASPNSLKVDALDALAFEILLQAT